MINQIISFSLKYRLIIILSTLLLVGIGMWVYTLLKIEAYPDISDTNVVIITQYEGRAAEEVEQQVTIPIERALNNVPGVIDRRSRTIFGLSVVQLSFKDGIEDFYARQSVLEKLNYAEIPDGIKPELGPLSSPVGEIFRYVLEGDENYTPMDIRTLNDWVVRPKLLQVSGLADIGTFGGPIQQYQVLTSPEKLRKYKLTIREVITSIQENNLNTGGNIIERGGQGFAIRSLGTIKDLNDLKNIVISSSKGVPIFLRDVAEVEIAPPNPSGIMGYTIPSKNIDVNSATEGIILLKRGENANDVLKDLQKTIEEIEKNDLPKGVKMHVLYNRSELIDYTLSTVSRTLIEGISIVVIILVLFLGSIRSALVVAISIPVSLLFAFILMKLTGIPANLLSLGAIDFGIIVDGACVMAEHLIRTIRKASPEERRKGMLIFAQHAAHEVGTEIVFSVTIIVFAYLPLFTLQRVEGKLFSPMAYTLSYAILGSMLCAVTIIPVLISYIYRSKFENLEKRLASRSNFIIKYLGLAYKNTLLFLFRIPFLGVFGTISVVVLSLVLGSGLGTEFLPSLDEGSIFYRFFQPSGISIKESAKLAPKIRKIVSEHPQIKSVITQTGRNDDGTDPFGANRTEILVALNDYSEWVHDTTKLNLVYAIKDQLSQTFPGAYISYGQPIIDQVTEIVNGSAADLAISIRGEDLVAVRAKANEIEQLIKGIKGATDVGLEQEGPQAQIVVEINRSNAARYGINVSDIQLMIEAAIGGKVVSTVYEGVKKFDLVIRFLPETRNTIDALKQILVPSLTGLQIPMSELAEIKLIDGQTNIYRSNNKRMITVRCNIKGRDQGGFASEASELIKENIIIPEEMDYSLGGQFENLARASKQLALVIPLTLFIIGLILFIMYRNIQDTLLTLLCVPFGLLGGIIALMTRSFYFNVSAGVGFISLFGVAVMAGVLLISAYNRAVKRELHLQNYDKKSYKKIIVDISNEQIRPILMMITVAMIGLVPAATSNGIGSDIQRPLATVIIGGLVSCLVLIPLLLPHVYFTFLKLKKPVEIDL